MIRIRIRIPCSAAAIVFAAAVAGCRSDPAAVCPGCPREPSVIVYGRVTSPSGASIAGLVRLDAGPQGCQTDPFGSTEYTNGTGAYRAVVPAVTDQSRQCIRITALAPAGSGLQNSQTVEVTVATPRRARADSVRADLTLRAQ
jgi:hypothetical protein